MGNIITAQITKIAPHPDAHKLKVCTVSDGTQDYQIVCGAKNALEGMVSILATEGSVLPSGKSITAAELRGVQSSGMLCSAKDLSLSDESGIIDLPTTTALGQLYTKLDPKLLSSVPWHRYQLVETHYQDGPLIKMTRTAPPKGMTIVSETYWDNSQYLYRNYL